MTRGHATGAVGLSEFDLPELHDRSPWIIGMIVTPDHRDCGLGHVLVEGIEAVAAAQGHKQHRVATERAAGFYQHCGFMSVEMLQVRPDVNYTVVKDLAQPTTD